MRAAVVELLRTETLQQVSVQETVVSSYDLAVTELSGTTVEIQFAGIANRQPNKTPDYAFLWQNPGVVPFGTAPLASDAILSATPDGDQGFGGLSLAALPYVLAYSVGPDTRGWNVAAVAPFGVGATQLPVQAITVTTAYVGTTSLAVSYTTPAGTTPLTFGHQLALVRNQGYYKTSPLIKMATPSDLDSDIVVFNQVPMTMGQYFTVAYLAGSAPANAAATVSFQVAPPAG
jgi:hypothetical protein